MFKRVKQNATQAEWSSLTLGVATLTSLYVFCRWACISCYHLFHFHPWVGFSILYKRWTNCSQRHIIRRDSTGTRTGWVCFLKYSLVSKVYYNQAIILNKIDFCNWLYVITHEWTLCNTRSSLYIEWWIVIMFEGLLKLNTIKMLKQYRLIKNN